MLDPCDAPRSRETGIDSFVSDGCADGSLVVCFNLHLWNMRGLKQREHHLSRKAQIDSFKKEQAVHCEASSSHGSTVDNWLYLPPKENRGSQTPLALAMARATPLRFPPVKGSSARQTWADDDDDDDLTSEVFSANCWPK